MHTSLVFLLMTVVSLHASVGSSMTGEEGPRLSVPPEKLAAAFTCSGDLRRSERDPVLLTPAFSSAGVSYGWNYLTRLPKLGVPTCAISVDDGGYGDLQDTAEYVVYAVRRMRTESNRKVVLLGHQHGALDEIWALTFWPDVARSVSDLVSLATPFNGTTSPNVLCRTGAGCAPATWQITQGSSFIEALAAAPLPAGPAYTSITSLDDALIIPQPEACRLDGGVNVVLQDLCPGRTVSHFDILADAVAYALVLDAIDHDGPADLRRVSRTVCAERLMPDTDPAFVAAANGFLPLFIAQNASAAVPVEPASRTYTARTGPEARILTRRTRLTREGLVPVRVLCTSVGETTCRARLELRTADRRIVGRGRFKVRSGNTRTVRVPVTIDGGGNGVRLRVTLRARDALRNASTSSRWITLGD
jgi:triacylglycerol lipase